MVEPDLLNFGRFASQLPGCFNSSLIPYLPGLRSTGFLQLNMNTTKLSELNEKQRLNSENANLKPKMHDKQLKIMM